MSVLRDKVSAAFYEVKVTDAVLLRWHFVRADFEGFGNEGLG